VSEFFFVSIEPLDEPVESLTITILDWNPPIPSSEELLNCPDQFRCFVCQKVKGRKKHFAGEHRFQRICVDCWGTVDSQSIRGLINFDLRHGHQVRMFPRAKFGSFYNILDGKKLTNRDLDKRQADQQFQRSLNREGGT